MRAFPLIAAALVAAGLPAAATAAPKKPLCQQLTDASGDGKAFTVSESAALDILSADIATGKRNFVAALRMGSVQRDQFGSGGMSYWVYFVTGGVRQSVALHVYQDGDVAGRYDAVDGQGTISDEVSVPVVVDPATNTITWTVPRKTIAALAKPKAKFTELSARATAALNRNDMGEGRSTLLGGDTATAEKTFAYTDQAPTCLKGT